MHHYPHHIGDFNAATRHLTRIERSIYRDLIDLYYDTEKPIPANEMPRLCRRILAISEEEKAAVDTVLEEFFTRDGDVWVHARCDEELAEYRQRDEGAEERRKHERDRQARYRERRAQLFAQLRELDVIPKFDTPIETLEKLLVTHLSRVTGVTRTESATAITINQEPVTSKHSALIVREAPNVPEAVDKSVAVDSLPPERGDGLRAAWHALAGNPPNALAMTVLDALAREGCTSVHLRTAWAVARERKPEPERIPIAYVAPIARDAMAGSLPAQRAARGVTTAALRAWMHDDKALERKAGELAITANRGESYEDLRLRVAGAIEAKTRGEP